MKIENVPSSFVYFLSGIGASAAVNLLTAIPVSGLNRIQTLLLVGFSIPWFGTSLMLAWTATALEEAHHKCSHLPTGRLNDKETAELRRKIFGDYRRQIIYRAYAALLFFIFGTTIVSVIDLQQYRSSDNQTSENRDIKLSSHEKDVNGIESQASGRKSAENNPKSGLERETNQTMPLEELPTNDTPQPAQVETQSLIDQSSDPSMKSKSEVPDPTTNVDPSAN
jgi:hypothetical protein